MSGSRSQRILSMVPITGSPMELIPSMSFTQAQRPSSRNRFCPCLFWKTGKDGNTEKEDSAQAVAQTVVMSMFLQATVVVLILGDMYTGILSILEELSSAGTVITVLENVSRVIVGLYAIEVLLRIFAFRTKLLNDWVEMVDIAAVVLAICLEFVLNSFVAHLAAALRVLRLLRIFLICSVQSRRAERKKVEIRKPSTRAALDTLQRVRAASTSLAERDSLGNLIALLTRHIQQFRGISSNTDDCITPEELDSEEDGELASWLQSLSGLKVKGLGNVARFTRDRDRIRVLSDETLPPHQDPGFDSPNSTANILNPLDTPNQHPSFDSYGVVVTTSEMGRQSTVSPDTSFAPLTAQASSPPLIPLPGMASPRNTLHPNMPPPIVLPPTPKSCKASESSQDSNPNIHLSSSTGTVQKTKAELVAARTDLDLNAAANPENTFDIMEREMSPGRTQTPRGLSAASRTASFPASASGPALVNIPALDDLDSMDFDIFALETRYPTNVLLIVAHNVFLEHQDILNAVSVPFEVLKNYVRRIEMDYGMGDNSYHTSTHAADALQTLHCLLKLGHLKDRFEPVEIFSLLLAAMVHDYRHPGVSNSYLVASRDPLALLYNDRSVCESHHASQAFVRAFSREDVNIFAQMTPETYFRVRQLVIDMVLATDMKFHFDNLQTWRTKMSILSPPERDAAPEERLLNLQMLLHCADISNPSKPYCLYQKWVARVMKEFQQQGFMESRRGLPISPFCDPVSVNVSACQKGFIGFIVRPTFQALVEFLPEAAEMARRIELNASAYQQSSGSATANFGFGGTSTGLSRTRSASNPVPPIPPGGMATIPSPRRLSSVPRTRTSEDRGFNPLGAAGRGGVAGGSGMGATFGVRGTGRGLGNDRDSFFRRWSRSSGRVSDQESAIDRRFSDLSFVSTAANAPGVATAVAPGVAAVPAPILPQNHEVLPEN